MRYFFVNICDFFLFLVLIAIIALMISVQILLKFDNMSIENQEEDISILETIFKQVGVLFFISMLLFLQKIFDMAQPFLVSLQKLKYKSSETISLRNKYFWSSVIKYLLFLYLNEVFFQEIWQDQRLGGLIFVSGGSINVASSVLLSFLITQPLFELINFSRLIQYLK